MMVAGNPPFERLFLPFPKYICKYDAALNIKYEHGFVAGVAVKSVPVKTNRYSNILSAFRGQNIVLGSGGPLHFRESIASEFPLAMHIPQLEKPSRDCAGDKKSGNNHEPLVKKYLFVLVLLILSVSFGLLTLHFAQMSVKDRDSRFVAYLWKLIACFVIARLLASSAGIEWAKILANK